jgi:hypothetical protein
MTFLNQPDWNEGGCASALRGLVYRPPGSSLGRLATLATASFVNQRLFSQLNLWEA